jgi:hypothetical protein
LIAINGHDAMQAVGIGALLLGRGGLVRMATWHAEDGTIPVVTLARQVGHRVTTVGVDHSACEVCTCCQHLLIPNSERELQAELDKLGAVNHRTLGGDSLRSVITAYYLRRAHELTKLKYHNQFINHQESNYGIHR